MPRGSPAITEKKPVDARMVQARARDPFDLTQVNDGGPDLHVVGRDPDFEAVIQTPGFYDETVHIRILDTGDVNAPRMVELGAGIGPIASDKKPIEDSDGKLINAKGLGIARRMAMMRNQIYRVPRYVVEILAHSKVTTLTQQMGPSNRPDDIVMVERHSFFYPFEVVRDDNPRGRMWLEKVLADPA